MRLGINAGRKCSESSCCSAWLLQSLSEASRVGSQAGAGSEHFTDMAKIPLPGFKQVLKGCVNTPCFGVNKACFGLFSSYIRSGAGQTEAVNPGYLPLSSKACISAFHPHLGTRNKWKELGTFLPPSFHHPVYF